MSAILESVMILRVELLRLRPLLTLRIVLHICRRILNLIVCHVLLEVVRKQDMLPARWALRCGSFAVCCSQECYWFPSLSVAVPKLSANYFSFGCCFFRSDMRCLHSKLI